MSCKLPPQVGASKIAAGKPPYPEGTTKLENLALVTLQPWLPAVALVDEPARLTHPVITKPSRFSLHTQTSTIPNPRKACSRRPEPSL